MHGQRRRRHPHDELDPRGAEAPPRRCCAWPGCEGEGAFRAPKSRDDLRAFHWFCLDHVREYNRAWDFFAGMNRQEIESYLREDVTWHRPTWAFGASAHRATGGWRWQDPFGAFTDDDSGLNGARARSETDRGRRPPGPASRAERMLAVLDLGPDTTREELRQRYRQLAKRHHPDLHGGDKRAEERLKRINEAYTYLIDSGLFV